MAITVYCFSGGFVLMSLAVYFGIWPQTDLRKTLGGASGRLGACLPKTEPVEGVLPEAAHDGPAQQDSIANEAKSDGPVLQDSDANKAVDDGPARLDWDANEDRLDAPIIELTEDLLKI
mmetsp:Transcript_47790/g.147337  ORF Transcript_47790/g.147337 Transcript_47790/m.147337 type:complete len:119 (+) Transcript_47790:835-1191(+)